MAIPVMSSQNINEMFLNAKKESELVTAEVQKIKSESAKKLMIINYTNEFINSKLDVINSGIIIDEKKVNFDYCYGIFNKYGYMIHPKFKKTPIDIFNLKLLSGDTMFKNSLISKINDIENDTYLNLLMADNSLKKEIIFDELKENLITIEYEIDNTVALGTNRFNTIEIDPYIYGAYDILSIDIYTLDTTGKLNAEPTKTLTGFQNIGKTRIILDEKMKFSKVKFTFKINFETEINNVKIYPFGLKHIHFLEADFLPESFAIIEIRSEKFIEYIYNDIILYSIHGNIETTCDEYDLELYTDYDKNTLTGKVYTSSDAGVNRIAKNTKVLYAKLPLIKSNTANKEVNYLSLNGIKFHYQNSEELINI